MTTNPPQNNLPEILTAEQLAQLARLLAPVMAHGWGTVTIDIAKHQVRFIRQQLSYEVELYATDGVQGQK